MSKRVEDAVDPEVQLELDDAVLSIDVELREAVSKVIVVILLRSFFYLKIEKRVKTALFFINVKMVKWSHVFLPFGRVFREKIVSSPAFKKVLNFFIGMKWAKKYFTPSTAKSESALLLQVEN